MTINDDIKFCLQEMANCSEPQPCESCNAHTRILARLNSVAYELDKVRAERDAAEKERDEALAELNAIETRRLEQKS